MRACVVGLLALTGCRSLFGLDEPGKLVDAADVSGMEMTADARACWGAGTGMNLCVPPPTMPLMLAGNVDTTACAAPFEVIGSFCGAVATELTLSSVNVTGLRPLLLVASSRLAITGTLDAASHRVPAKIGPAADAVCGTGTLPLFADTTTTGGSGAGGAGGAFVHAAGRGGGRDANVADGSGVPPAPMGIPSTIRGGCRGQNGAVKAGSGTVPAAGGSGGGAVYLISGDILKVEAAGAVNASGAGGTGGVCGPCSPDTQATNLQNAAASGGGGGGSGGTIVLEAPTIIVDGKVFADGGAGGGGSSRTQAGQHGEEPDGTKIPAGGNTVGGPNNAGNGGTGTFATPPTGGAGEEGAPGTAPGGGGGGGGGAGYIRIIGTRTGAGTVSPAPS